MAITTTPYDPVYEPTACMAAPRLGSEPKPYDPVYEPTACMAAPRLGSEPKATVEEQPLAIVLDKTLSTICDTNSVLLDVCNALACSGLLKSFPGELRSDTSIASTIYNSNDAAAAGNAAAKLIRSVLIGGEF